MSDAPTRNAMRLNRWIAGVGGLLFINNCLRTLNDWGAAFGTLAFAWVACRFPFSNRPWAPAGRRTAGLAFVATALAAIWFTIRG